MNDHKYFGQESLRHLFIGGIADGKRLRTDGSGLYEIEYEEKVSTRSGDEVFHQSFGVESYRREEFRTEENVFSVYVLADFSRDRAIKELIQGYSGKYIP